MILIIINDYKSDNSTNIVNITSSNTTINTIYIYQLYYYSNNSNDTIGSITGILYTLTPQIWEKYPILTRDGGKNTHPSA